MQLHFDGNATQLWHYRCNLAIPWVFSSLSYRDLILLGTDKYPITQPTLFAESQEWKHKNNVWNMFKVNNKETRTMSMTSFWFLYCLLWIYFTHCSSVSIVDFEQVNVGWEGKVYLGPWKTSIMGHLGKMINGKDALSPWFSSLFFKCIKAFNSNVSILLYDCHFLSQISDHQIFLSPSKLFWSLLKHFLTFFGWISKEVYSLIN